MTPHTPQRSERPGEPVALLDLRSLSGPDMTPTHGRGVRAFVVVNPRAGAGRTERLWPALAARLRQRGVTLEVAATTAPGEATALVAQAAAAGWPLVVAVGGDGTVNEAVNGIVLDAGDRPQPILAAILTGRGRDACPNFGVIRDPVAAADRVVDGDDTLIDVGIATAAGQPPRAYVGFAGAGLDARVAVNAAGRRGGGSVPYVVATLKTVWSHRPTPAAITIDGARAFTGPLWSAVIANAPFFGGGLKIAPDADPRDGRLDLVVVGDFGRLELLWWFPRLYRGTHVRSPRVAVRRGSVFRIEAETPLPMQVDGEGIGTTPGEILVRPQALRLRR